jgi:hypothetical protein
VTCVLLWPTSRLICSMCMPRSDSADTKLCLSSRGVQFSPMPTWLQLVTSAHVRGQLAATCEPYGSLVLFDSVRFMVGTAGFEPATP